MTQVEDQAARVERMLEGLREIRQVSSLKRLEASVTDDPAVRLRVAGQALERIDTIVSALLDESGGGPSLPESFDQP